MEAAHVREHDDERSFDQDTSRAKIAAAEGPVIITEGGSPVYVLMTYDAYKDLKRSGMTLGEALYMPGVADIELVLPTRDLPTARNIFPDD